MPYTHLATLLSVELLSQRINILDLLAERLADLKLGDAQTWKPLLRLALQEVRWVTDPYYAPNLQMTAIDRWAAFTANLILIATQLDTTIAVTEISKDRSSAITLQRLTHVWTARLNPEAIASLTDRIQVTGKLEMPDAAT